MPNYDYFKSWQTQYDFSPIYKGTVAGAEAKAAGIQSAAGSLLGAITRKRENEMQDRRLAEERYFRASEQALGRQHDERRAAEDRLMRSSEASLSRDWEAGQRSKDRGSRLMEQWLQNQGMLDRERAQIQAAKTKQEAGAKAIEFAHMMMTNKSTMNPLSSIDVSGRRGGVFRGMSDQELQQHLERTRDPENAKAAFKALSATKTVQFVYPDRLSKIEAMIAARFGPEAAENAVEEVYRKNYPIGVDEAVRRTHDEFGRQFDKEFKQKSESGAAGGEMKLGGVDVSGFLAGGDFTTMPLEQKLQGAAVVNYLMENHPLYKAAVEMAAKNEDPKLLESIREEAEEQAYQNWSGNPYSERKRLREAAAAKEAADAALNEPSIDPQKSSPLEALKVSGELRQNIKRSLAEGDWETWLRLMDEADPQPETSPVPSKAAEPNSLFNGYEKAWYKRFGERLATPPEWWK